LDDFYVKKNTLIFFIKMKQKGGFIKEEIYFSLDIAI